MINAHLPMRWIVSLSLVLAFSCATVPGLAQDVLRPGDYQPVAEPREPASNRLPPELPRPDIEVPEGDKVLVDALVGVRFVPSQDQVRRTLDIEGVQTEQVPPLDTAEFRAGIEPHLGRPITWNLIGDMVRQTILHYRGLDRPVVDVIVPEQDITNGVVQLLVIEGMVGEIGVTGNAHFTDEQIRGKVRLEPGDPIFADRLISDVNYINSNPFRFVRPVLSPGEEVGTTDVQLQTEDRRPWRVYYGFEDTGNSLTRRERHLFGFNCGNFLGREHEIGYQFASEPNFSDIHVHSAYWRIPLPNRDKLSFFGYYADFDAFDDGLVAEVGTSWQISARYIHRMDNIGSYSQQLTGGFDFKRTNTNFTSGGVTVYDGVVDTTQFTLEYAGAMPDSMGETSFTWAGFWSPCGISSRADGSDYEAARTGADPAYAYTRLDVQRVWDLPEGFTFVNILSGQLSTDRLLGTEQMGFGGFNSVRGYDLREVNADQGLVFTLELRTPEYRLFQLEEDPNLDGMVQLLGFWDYGMACNRGNVAGEDKHSELQGIGFGVNTRLGEYINVRFSYGWRLAEPGTDRHDIGRCHLGILVAY